MLEDTTFILRECGERTADAAFERLQSLAPPRAITRINVSPFSEAVKASFEVGGRESRRWTLCIDADVLVDANAIRELAYFAERLPDHIFEVQGFVFDKFFGVERPAGNHLYRTERLPIALEMIPPEGESLRPEHSTIQAMESHGYPDIQAPIVVGLHDFEQYHADVFRKAFLQAHKHDWLADYLVARWERLAGEDSDYQTALLGFSEGRSFHGSVFVCRDFQREEISERLLSLRISEKEKFSHCGIDLDIFQELQCQRRAMTAAELERQAKIKAFYFGNCAARNLQVGSRPFRRKIAQVRSFLGKYTPIFSQRLQ